MSFLHLLRRLHLLPPTMSAISIKDYGQRSQRTLTLPLPEVDLPLGWNSSPPPLSTLGIWSGLSLHWSRTCHNHGEFICVVTLQHLEDTVSLCSSTTSGSCSLPTASPPMTPGYKEERVDYRCYIYGWILFSIPWLVVLITTT